MARRVGHASIQETVRKVLLTYWNTVAFHALYARTNSWTPTGDAPAPARRHVLDRWLTSATHQLVVDVTAALENFDTQRTGTLLSEFVDDLSNWYVRRSRRRFWDGDPSALWTLHETLHTLTRLMAPMVPFITERVWQDLFVATDPQGPASVHLASWPVGDVGLIDSALSAKMRLTRRLVELGRSARSEAKVKTRQPLSRLLVPSAAFAQLDADLCAEMAAELNVATVESFAGAGDLVDYNAKGNFRALGKRFGKATPQVAKAIADADAAVLAASLAATGAATVDYEGGIEVSTDEVLISERPREGWSVVNEQGETVALDLRLTPELVSAGRAREAIRFVQEQRKLAGFEVSDRIRLVWDAAPDLAAALAGHAELIAAEVLAISISQFSVDGKGLPDSDWVEDQDSSLRIQLAKV